MARGLPLEQGALCGKAVLLLGMQTVRIDSRISEGKGALAGHIPFEATLQAAERPVAVVFDQLHVTAAARAGPEIEHRRASGTWGESGWTRPEPALARSRLSETGPALAAILQRQGLPENYARGSNLQTHT